ncbi:hypothetical protein ACFLZZ_01770 [Nanoarchaeota archaeon]
MGKKSPLRIDLSNLLCSGRTEEGEGCLTTPANPQIFIGYDSFTHQLEGKVKDCEYIVKPGKCRAPLTKGRKIFGDCPYCFDTSGAYGDTPLETSKNRR